ncbi:MAG: T9SS type A sorting domain-containing protein, partial [Chitinophagales bacterium]|nr:T9SS type A sorting domain-containing protein [Chitinophagales bacterium]
ATVSVINVNGQVVQHYQKEFQAGLTNQAIAVGSLPAGIYFVQFRANEVVKTERISIMK